MTIPERWSPRLLLSLRNYSAKDFTHDLIAGLTVGLVALPLAMAFGISSGVSPQAGIYTAVVAGFIISALGGSKTQIGGPTGAFVVIVAGIIAKFGAGGLVLVTIMAGALRATSMAANHNSPGILAFPWRFCLHCPKRVRT